MIKCVDFGPSENDEVVRTVENSQSQPILTSLRTVDTKYKHNRWYVQFDDHGSYGPGGIVVTSIFKKITDSFRRVQYEDWIAIDIYVYQVPCNICQPPERKNLKTRVPYRSIHLA